MIVQVETCDARLLATDIGSHKIRHQRQLTKFSFQILAVSDQLVRSQYVRLVIAST